MFVFVYAITQELWTIMKRIFLMYEVEGDAAFSVVSAFVASDSFVTDVRFLFKEMVLMVRTCGGRQIAQKGNVTYFMRGTYQVAGVLL